MSWPKGPEPAEEGMYRGAGTVEWPGQPVFPPGLWESVFHRSTTGRRGLWPRGLKPPGVRRRSEGRSPPSRRAAPRIRPSGAHSVGSWLGAGPQPGLRARFSGRPRATVEAGFLKQWRLDTGQSFLARKASFCRASVCLVQGNISYPTRGQHSVIARDCKVFGNFKKRFMILVTVMHTSGKMIFITVKSNSVCQMI